MPLLLLLLLVHAAHSNRSKAVSDKLSSSTMVFRVYEKWFDMHGTDPDTGGYAVDRIEEIGSFQSRKLALEAAIQARDRYFDSDWVDVMTESGGEVNEPPFVSWDVENPDNDEGCIIYIEDENEAAQANKRKIESLLSKDAEKKKAVVPKKRVFGKATRDSNADTNIFIRNPSRLVPVAVPLAPTEFPGSGASGFVDLIRRWSNGCYACKAVADGYGVQYRTHAKKRNHILASISWVPGTNLDHHSGNDPSIVDTVHTDLIRNNDGKPRSTVADIANWCTPEIKHLYLNKLPSPSEKNYKDAAKIIRELHLETFATVEWENVPACIFEALALQDLKGIHMNTCDIKNQASYRAMVRMIGACPNLKFLALDILGDYRFTNALLEALPASLEVLFIRGGAGHKNAKGLDLSKLDQLENLKVRMVFPDNKFKSL